MRFRVYDEDGKEKVDILGDADTVDNIHAATTATVNKLLALNADSKLPASITGDADTVDGKHAGNAADNVLLLDGSGLVPLADIPVTLTGKDADTVDGFHASATSAANKLLAMDANAKMPGHTVASNLNVDGGLNIGTATEAGPGAIRGKASGAIVWLIESADTYAQLQIKGAAAGDVTWGLLSGYPTAGDFTIRETGVADRIIVKKTTGNTTITGTLTVNGDQTGATDHVFDGYDDIALLRKWRQGQVLPFEVGDMLNRDRLLRDTILQLEARVAALEARAES